MTLKLQVDYFQPKNRIDKVMQLSVVGSKAGPLESKPTVSAREHKWTPQFLIECAKDDDLVFILYTLEGGEKIDIGRTTLHCFGFLEMEKDKKNLSSINPTKYKFDFQKKDEFVGSLFIWIVFEPTLYFQGEFFCKPNLDIRIAKKSQVHQEVSKQSKIVQYSKVGDSKGEKKLEENLKLNSRVEEVHRSSHKMNEISKKESQNEKIVRVLKSNYSSKQEKGVQIYMGKCPTVNMFSFFDEAVNGQKCNLSEDIYRDSR